MDASKNNRDGLLKYPFLKMIIKRSKYFRRPAPVNSFIETGVSDGSSLEIRPGLAAH